MGYRLGIDLGTTFTAAATDAGGDPRMVGLGNRALQVPSVLYLKEDGTFLCGEAAERRAVEQPDRVVREFKRRIGDTVPMLVAGHPFSPQALSAKLLAWVVATATEREGEAPEEVVLTHPANWGGFKRELFGQVASLADLSRFSTCAEPEAAAIQYASRAHLQTGDRVVVYDLGGGTFDVCTLRMTDDGCEILGAPDGVEHLGGIDFDEAVFRHVLDSLGEQAAALDPDEPEVTAGLIRMRRDCVEAKEALSNDVDTVVPVHLPGISTSVRLTRPELEALIAPAIGETLAATRRALRSAETSTDDLAAVVLVGGSSRIPLISQRLQNELGVSTAMDTHPKHDIALGAVQRRRGASGEVAQPALSRAVPTVPAWPTRDAGGPPTVASPAARPREPEAATQPIPAVRETRTAEPARRASGPPAPGAPPSGPVSSQPPEREGPPGRFGAAPPWRWVAVAAGLFLVAGGAAVALVVDQDDEGGGATDGSPGTGARESIAAGEVVVPLDQGDGIALYALEQGGSAGFLVGPGEGMALSVPSISPDRRFVYYREGSPDDFREFETRVLDLSTGETAPMVGDGEDAVCIGRPAWNPSDSSSVAVLCAQGEVNLPFQGVQGDDGRITDIELIPGLGPGWVNVAYLGDGDLVLTQGQNTESPGIYTARPGEAPSQLTSGPTGDTAASPFDSQIAYEQDGDLWLVRADGGVPDCAPEGLSEDTVTGAQRCRLTDGGSQFDIKPAWEEAATGESPRRLVFVRSDDDDAVQVQGDMLVLDVAEGGEPQPWSGSIGTVSGQPAWSHR